ncbi:hypothetical protein J4717_04845 [Phaeobacter sp. HS012]|uniref:hypothetical protein n=2 Tax=unclassified Phaeobacter TaxID=2621772 RepID=UPI001B38CF7B|nr:hypothetical protein [Phaeobacter sp. HS011]MBQ4806793.1 hypothetical protein [Phaeobacter sp. HS012]MBQ4881643.1 hypothetical protein [Phaeobacter sp. HS011]
MFGPTSDVVDRRGMGACIAGLSVLRLSEIASDFRRRFGIFVWAPRSGPGSTCRGHRENRESRGVARASFAEKRRNIGSLRLRRSEPTRLADTLDVFCFLGKPDSEMIKLWKAESLEFREAACAIEVRVEGTSNFYSIFDCEDIEGHHVSGSMKEYLIKKTNYWEFFSEDEQHQFG